MDVKTPWEPMHLVGIGNWRDSCDDGAPVTNLVLAKKIAAVAIRAAVVAAGAPLDGPIRDCEVAGASLPDTTRAHAQWPSAPTARRFVMQRHA